MVTHLFINLYQDSFLCNLIFYIKKHYSEKGSVHLFRLQKWSWHRRGKDPLLFVGLTTLGTSHKETPVILVLL